MKQVVIENPTINSPFEEPKRHFRFSDEGITDEIVEDRRDSSYFIPIARPKKKSPQQLAFDAVNNHAGYGRWAFIEISDPWDAKNTIRTALQAVAS